MRYNKYITEHVEPNKYFYVRGGIFKKRSKCCKVEDCFKISSYGITKLKYPELFKRKNYPLSNIFINNLLKDYKNFMGCYSKDQIPLVENNKSIIMNLNNSNEPGSHWIALKRVNNGIYVFDSFNIGFLPIGIFKIYKNYKIITNIYRIQDISSNLCGMFYFI